MDTIWLGDLRIDRVEELSGIRVGFEEMIVDLPPDAIARNLDWLAPHHYDPESCLALTTVQSWLVRTPRFNILIDTCFGEDKTGIAFSTSGPGPNWVDRLAEKGLSLDSIDFVMCTHVHADHVGWNTRLVDGRWVPTFPNARYLFGRKEYEAWTDGAAGWAEKLGHQHVFNESVLPCIEHGRADLIDGGHMIDEHLTVEDAPGHTAGNSVVRALTRMGGAIFAGDVVHSAIQLAYPECNSIACQFPDQARATRRQILGDCADNGHLLLPAHFGRPHCGRVRRVGDVFGFVPGS